MDPNANLQEQERIIAHPYYPMIHCADRNRLRELRSALFTWIDRGGFEPDWRIAPLAARFYRRG